MNRRDRFRAVLLAVVLGGLFTLTRLGAQDAAPKPDADKKAEPAPAVKAKPLGDSAKKGIAYLINQQHDDGGWGQGGGWRTGDKGGNRVEGKEVKDPSDVGNTCVAALALIRAGHTPKEGEYAKNVLKAVEFLCKNVEKADAKSLYVTDVRNTQLQSKIGPYVDTFLAMMLFSELKGKMPDEKSEKQMVACLNKIIGKIEDNQQADGNFANNQAWASTLSMALCSKGLWRARQNGFTVNDAVLARNQKQVEEGFDKKSGDFTAAKGAAPSDAGVKVYQQSGKAAGIQEEVNTLRGEQKKNQEVVTSKTAPKEEKDRAMRDLKRLEVAESNQAAANTALVARLDDKQFVQGFGSNGGEEFLSYMNISETLVVQGGKEWEKWDKAIADNLNRVQDKDGGWSGHHCITGRTFCTAAALLTLMADRAPIPVAAKDKKVDEKK